MEAFLDFLKNSHLKDSDEIELMLRNTLELINGLNSSELFSKEEIDSDIKTYFFSKFVGGIVEAILHGIRYNKPNPMIKDLQREILEQFLKIFVNNMENQQLIPMFENLASIFSDEQNFYRNNEGRDVAEEYLQRVYRDLCPQGFKWRADIQEGSVVDYLQTDSNGPKSSSFGVSNWTRAKVISIDEENLISLKLIGTGALVNKISLYSPYILPFNTLSTDFEWREELKTGDEIDFLDNRSWYLSTVVDSCSKMLPDGSTRKYVKCGNRIFRPDGKCEDSTKKKYFGWSENFDKEVSVHDPKIRHANEFSKIINNYHLISTYPIDSRKFNEIESFIPFETKDSSQRFYMVPKKTDGRNVDVYYYLLINNFCNDEQGLEKIVDILKSYKKSEDNEINSTSPVNYDMVVILIDVIFNIHNSLHIKFAKTYLKEFLSLCFEILNKFSRTEIRNFKRDKIESSFKKLKEILIKVYMDVDVNVLYDMFGVEFGLNCFKSSTILDKKLLGLKILTETLSDVTRSGPGGSSAGGFHDKHLPAAFLMAKVLIYDESGSNIFDLLFGSQSHSQILNKSPDLIKTFFMGRVLSPKDIDKLILMIKHSTDQEIKNVIFKSLSNNTQHMGSDLLIYLIRKIMQSELNNFSSMDLDLLISAFKSLPNYSIREVAPQIGDFLFDSVFTSTEPLIENKTYEQMSDEFVSLLKSTDFRDSVIEYIERSILLLKDEKFDFMRIIKFLRKLLTSLFNIIEETKKVVLLELILGEKKNIIDLALNYLTEYHTCCKNTKSNLNLNIEDNVIIPLNRKNSTSHNETLSEITLFLSIFNNIKSFSFGYDHIHLLFRIFVEDGITSKDSNLFFKFLKDAEDSGTMPSGAFEIIFSKMIEREDLEFSTSSISLDLFKTLWNIFTTINKNQSKLKCEDYKGEATYAYSGVSNSGQTLLSYSYNPEKKTDCEVSLQISNPLDLSGFDLIWKLMVSSPSGSEVNKMAINNVLKLFLGENKNLWNILIEKCIKTINCVKLSQTEDFNSKKIKISNILHLLKSLIEETEKKGTAGCISHSSILKNSKIKIIIKNMISPKLLNPNENYNNAVIKDSSTTKEFILVVYSNTTLWDLKKLIGFKIGVIPEGLKFLNTGGKEITDNDHGKTLMELKIKDKDTLSVVKNPILDQIPKVPLMKDGQLVEKAVKAFSEIFEKFSTEGLMSKEQCAQFAYAAVDSVDPISPDDNRIKSVYDMHDINKDGFLSLDEFLSFFRSSIVDQKKPHIVWDNLKAFNYRNDLKKLNEPLDIYNTQIELMPRFILSKNQEYFETIFKLQDDEDQIGVARETSKFLSMICTNPIIFKEIILLNKNKIIDWTEYLESSNPYKLLYTLQIIESFFEEFELDNIKVDSEALENTILDPSERELLLPNHKLIWIEKFLVQGGVSHVIKLLLNIQYSKYGINSQYRRCLNLLIKILRNSLTLLFRASSFSKSSEKNQKDEVIQLMRKESLEGEAIVSSNLESNNELSQEDEKTIKNIFNDSEKVESGVNSLGHEEDSLSHKNIKMKNDLEKDLIDILNNYYKKDALLKNLDFTILSHKLISLSWEIMNKQDTDLEERTLITNSINLLSLIIISQEKVSSFVEYKIFTYQTEDFTFPLFIVHGLLLSNLLTRLNFNRTFSNLSTQLCNLKEYSFTIGLYEILNTKITNLSLAEKSQSKYFFELFQSVMDNLLKIKSDDEKLSKINFVELALNIVDLFSKEKNNIQEEVLIGYMKILNVILKNKDEKFKSFIGIENGLINIIIDNYLIKDTNFEVPSDNQNLIKLKENSDQEGKDISDISCNNYSSGDCRLIIFNLLSTLMTDNFTNIQIFFANEKISELSSYLTKLKKDQRFYSPGSDKRSMHGYAGVKNLQCICYMISVLQQFFNIPTFRYAIMQADDQKPIASGVDDNVLHQLQKMFTYLELTQRNEYNPIDFCHAFKDLDGNPTNVSIQQDAQEFLGRLFDIVENTLKSTAHKYIFQSVFLGKTCSQLICKGGCGKVRNTFEDFYNLSLEVQNKRSLKESLEKYISEDQIDDFYCDNCKKKTSVIRRTSFSSLPNVLIVHLQRILFNYESLMNEKINSRLEFPNRLDLKEFCTETLNKESNEQEQEDVFNQKVYVKEDEYYKYELVGVVVHLGVADAGHYYSYINVQREGNSEFMNFDPTNEKDLNKWLTFNDSSVSSFLIKNLEEDCFGGSSKENDNKNFNDDDLFSGWGPRNRGQNYDFENSKNAYMLVYERIKKSPLKMTLVSDDEIQDKINLMNREVYNFNDENKNEVLKKFDTFAKVSLDCENTAVSRRDEETSNSVKETKGIYDYVFHNETNDEYTYYLPFYSLEHSVPSSYYYDVSKDNICFSNDQKIFSNNFAVFIEKTLENTVKILKAQQENSEEKQNDLIEPISQNEIGKIFFISLRFLLEIFSKSNFKENLRTIIDHMCEILRLHPDFSDSVLEYLFFNKDKLIEILFSSEESANVSYKNLIVNSIIENFKIHSEVIQKYLYSISQEKDENNENSHKDSMTFIPYSISILDYIYSLLPGEASKQWTKIYAYLDLFSSLALSNEELIIEYMFKKETIYRLVDFMLGKESPYYNRNENRTEMGSKVVTPKFYPLISTISILVRHCGTKTWARGEISLELVDVCPPSTYINCMDKIFHMSDRDYDCLSETNFYKKAFKDSYYNLGMSRLIAHLMYKNYNYSKKRTFTIMEAINEVIPTNEAKAAFDLIFHVLLIEDQFTVNRMEWIFGIPQINIKLNETPSLPPRETKWGEKIRKYISPITYGTNHESLLERLLHKYQASTDFITILNYFFGVIFSRRHTLNYFDSLPHPRNDMQFIKDHIFHLGEQEMNRILASQSLATKYEKQIKGFTNIIENYDKKKEDLNSQVNDENKAYTQYEFKFSSNYKMKNLVREHVQNIPHQELNQENLYCMIVDYDVEVISDDQQTKKEIEDEINQNTWLNNNKDHTNINNNQTQQDFTRSDSTDPEKNGYTLIKLQNEADNETYPLPPEEDQVSNHDGSMEAVQGDEEGEMRKENLALQSIVNEIEGRSDEAKENDIDRNYSQIQQKITQGNNITLSNIKNSNRNIDNRNRHKRSNSEDAEFIGPKVPPINISGGKIYSSQSSSDEIYFRQNFLTIYQNETHSRTFINKSEISKSSVILNCLKRYVLYNNSEKEYKVRFRFFSKDDDFINTYIPASELVVYSKKDSVNTIHVFSKDDFELPWSEFGVEIQIEKYEDDQVEESKVNSNANNKSVKKSNSYDNLRAEEPLALPAAESIAIEGGAEDCFPIGEIIYLNKTF
jgi:ubiquitin C-terminal hydrolase